MADPLRRSLEDLETLKTGDPAARCQAIEGLCEAGAGWWGPGSLALYAFSVGKHQAKKQSEVRGLTIDQLDWEGAVEDSLITLFVDASKITKNPKSWLHGVIKNKIRTEVRSVLKEIKGAREKALVEPATAGSPEDALIAAEGASKHERKLLELFDELHEVVASLPKSLRIIVWLMNDGYSREEIAEKLSLSSATVRKRIQRLRQALIEAVAHRLR